MNKKLRIFLSISMLLSLSFFFVGCSNFSKNMSTSELKSLPENHLEGTFGIDMYNPEETCICQLKIPPFSHLKFPHLNFPKRQGIIKLFVKM
ncbi:hypothetical protein HHO41_21735, partial [Bacillus sp. DNRA2]|uniref:hypothetical protein n=1 Tax=Bacillus sp. DNRA2 TaxID=2723053 RepID=UPI00145E1B20